VTTTTPLPDVLTDLDFTPALPCEDEGHGIDEFTDGGCTYLGHPDTGPAAWWVAATCPRCGRTDRFAACDGYRVDRSFDDPNIGTECKHCGWRDDITAFRYTFTPLRGDA